MKFKSPIGNTRVPTGTSMREFSVPDETGGLENFNVDQAINQPGMKQINPKEMDDFLNRLNQSYGPQDMGEVEQVYAPQANTSQLEQEMRQARIAKVSGKQRLDQGAKYRLEMLLGMMRHTRSVKIGEVEFVLQTLNGKDEREAIKAASAYDGTPEVAFEIRNQLLARAIKKIGGAEFDHILGSSSLEAKLDALSEFDNLVLNKLNSELVLLNKEVNDSLNLNNEENLKGVLSDIKK